MEVTLGTSTEATTWVNNSGLSDEFKSNLVTFIDNFPTLVFTQESDDYLNGVESVCGLTIPLWLRDLRKVLAGVDTSMPARFIAYDGDCSRFDIVHKIWYTFSLGDMSDDDRAIFVDYAKMYPIGSWVENDRSYLAVNLEDPQDRSIYEFAREDLVDAQYEGVSSYPDAVFSSYPRMLSRLYQFKSPNGDVLQAVHM
ncbi:hypothetical protein [Streptomyces sp. NPDC058155]|uniref:hypothetical protein n=1 Tax=Streptomyces sp. NPDC058155 TaxID=3346359 RepID=UPI0036E9DE46